MEMNDFYLLPGEKPLDRLAPDGGFCGIFRRFGCIGDSLSSGEFESLVGGTRTYHDLYDYSWGQYLARLCGSSALNFSRGGMTAKEYCQSFAEANGYWDPSLACPCYIVALGVNDLYGGQPVGSLADVDIENEENNADTFAGWYGRILTRLKRISPKARVFLVTLARESADGEDRAALKRAHAALLKEFAAKYPFTYVIDLLTYGPDYSDPTFRSAFYHYGHLNAAGYLFTAKLFAGYIDYYIRSDFASFAQVGLIGTEFYDETLDK